MFQAFVYISTIFSNFPKFEIHEEIYESKITADKLINLVNSLDDDILEHVQPG